MIFFDLPSDILSEIYQMDPTYRIIQELVFKEVIDVYWTRFFDEFLQHDFFGAKMIKQLRSIFDYIVSEKLYGTSHPDTVQITSRWKDIAYSDNLISYNNNWIESNFWNVDDNEFYTDIHFGVGADYKRLETIVFINTGTQHNFHDLILSSDDEHCKIVRVFS